MTVAEELERLQSLFNQGALSAEEYAKAKANVLGHGTTATSAAQQFRLSNSDRVFGGVCGGLSKVTNMPSWVWRIVFVVCFFGMGFGFLLYVLLWIFVPRE